MIDVKQAVQLAKEFVEGMYSPEQFPNLRLEEVDRTEDGTYWLITIGFDRVTYRSRSAFAEYAGLGGASGSALRDYKILKIDAENGEVDSMRIRELNAMVAI